MHKCTHRAGTLKKELSMQKRGNTNIILCSLIPYIISLSSFLYFNKYPRTIDLRIRENVKWRIYTPQDTANYLDCLAAMPGRGDVINEVE